MLAQQKKQGGSQYESTSRTILEAPRTVQVFMFLIILLFMVTLDNWKQRNQGAIATVYSTRTKCGHIRSCQRDMTVTATHCNTRYTFQVRRRITRSINCINILYTNIIKYVFTLLEEKCQTDHTNLCLGSYTKRKAAEEVISRIHELWKAVHGRFPPKSIELHSIEDMEIRQNWKFRFNNPDICRFSPQCGIWYPMVPRYPLWLLQLFSRSNRWLSCRFTIRTRWSHSAWPPRSGQESSQDASRCPTKRQLQHEKRIKMLIMRNRENMFKHLTECLQ